VPEQKKGRDLKDVKKALKKEVFDTSSYALPDIGSKIDYKKFWETDDFKKRQEMITKTLSEVERLAIRKNFDPELNKTLALIPFFRQAIKDKRLEFHAEVPGVNSDRAFFGFKYNL